jgi:hypothetical protein
MSSGCQAPCTSLVRFGREEQQVDQEQHGAARDHQPQRRAPVPPDDVEEQQRGDGDRACHGHTEGVGDRSQGLEREHQGEDGKHQSQLIHGT